MADIVVFVSCKSGDTTGGGVGAKSFMFEKSMLGVDDDDEDDND